MKKLLKTKLPLLFAYPLCSCYDNVKLETAPKKDITYTKEITDNCSEYDTEDGDRENDFVEDSLIEEEIRKEEEEEKERKRQEEEEPQEEEPQEEEPQEEEVTEPRKEGDDDNTVRIKKDTFPLDNSIINPEQAKEYFLKIAGKGEDGSDDISYIPDFLNANEIEQYECRVFFEYLKGQIEHVIEDFKKNLIPGDILVSLAKILKTFFDNVDKEFLKYINLIIFVDSGNHNYNSKELVFRLQKGEESLQNMRNTSANKSISKEIHNRLAGEYREERFYIDIKDTGREATFGIITHKEWREARKNKK